MRKSCSSKVASEGRLLDLSRRSLENVVCSLYCPIALLPYCPGLVSGDDGEVVLYERKSTEE